VKSISLTPNEQRVLYGLVRYPCLNDSELSVKIGVKLSTLTSIKRRLNDQNVFRQLLVPLLNRLGSELLAVIYTQFNPVIPLEERVSITKETIEVFDEIFFSTGEQEKGFSISLAKDYTSIGRIDDIRTETFGSLGLLEKEYPSEVIFPFKSSEIIRFFDFSRVLRSMFDISDSDEPGSDIDAFSMDEVYSLSSKEKRVYTALVQYPTATTQEIGEKVGLSRHTVSRMKKKFFDLRLLKHLTIPDMRQLGFEILSFYHYQFSPGKSPSMEDILYLDGPSTVFLARRKYEIVMISAYQTYQEYKEDKMKKIRFLKENDFISYTPLVRKYMFERMVFLKNFVFHPIAKKIIE
jgi:DNA-binding MarR family transcriptional regulator